MEDLRGYVLKNQHVKLQQFLQKKKNIVNTINIETNGFLLLHFAVEVNALESVRVLIQHGCDVNIKKYETGDTPLHVAVRKNCLEIASFLQRNKADGNLRNKDDKTPLDISIEKHYFNRLIQRHGRNDNERARQIESTGPKVRTNDDEADKDMNVIPPNPGQGNQGDQRQSVSSQLREYDVTNGGMGGMDGNLYQILTLILVCLRAQKNYKRFKIMPEMKIAGKFDDIVIRYFEKKQWHTRLMQLKHRSSKNPKHNTVRIEDLGGSRANDFKLINYFESIKKLKDEKLENFFICTTACLDESVKTFFQNHNSHFKEDRLLFFNDDPLLCEEEAEEYVFKGNLHRLSQEGLPHILGPQWNQSNMYSESDLEKICKKFYFITSYPNVVLLSKLLLKEIGDQFQMRNAVFIHDFFIRQMTDYIRSSIGTPLTEKTVKNFMKTVEANLSTQYFVALTKQKISQIDSYEIHFHETHLKLAALLRGDTSSNMLKIKTESVDLALINVVDELRRTKHKDGDFFVINLRTFDNAECLLLEALKFLQSTVLVLLECDSDIFLRGLSSESPKVKIISIEASKCSQPEDDRLGFGNLVSDAQTLIKERCVLFQGHSIIFQELLSDSDMKILLQARSLQAIAKQKEVHIAEELDCGGDLYASDTHIVRTLAKGSNSNKEEESFVSADISACGKVIVLTGEAGMGKSHFSSKLKADMQIFGHWVIQINLKHYTTDRRQPFHLSQAKFENGNLDAASKFLVEMVKPLYKTTDVNFLVTFPLLEALILSRCSLSRPFQQNRRLVVIFNGFDEIFPTYRENVLRLIGALNVNACLQIWLATRTLDDTRNFERLKTTNYLLNPFKIEDQVTFMIKHLKLLSHENRQHIDHFVVKSNMLTLFNFIVKDAQSSTTCSEQRRELHILLDSSEMPDTLTDVDCNFSQNFKDFTKIPLMLKMLLDLCLEPQPLGEMGLSEIYGKFIARQPPWLSTNAASELLAHGWAALFPESNAASGVAETSLTIMPHRSYAEYAVAEDLLNGLCGKDLNLVNRIFLEDSFKWVCSFLNEKLMMASSCQQFARTSLVQQYVWQPNESGENILHIAAERGQIEVLKYFRQQFDSEMWSELLTSSTNMKETVFDKAALSKDYPQLFDFFKDNLQREAFEGLLQRSRKYKLRLLKTAIEDEDYGKLRACFEKINRIESLPGLFTLKNGKGENMAHIAASKGKFKVITEARKHFSAEAFRNILLGTANGGKTVLHVAAYYGHFSLMLEHMEDYQIFEKILFRKDVNQWTALHYAAQTGNGSDAMFWFRKHFSENRIDELLRAVTSNGETLLHIAAANGHFAAIAEQLLKQLGARFKEFVLRTDRNGWTCLHSAAAFGSCGQIISFFERHTKDFPKNDVEQLFLSLTSNDETLLHVAVEKGHFAVTANSILRRVAFEKFKNLIFAKANNDSTCLHKAAEFGKCGEILSVLKNVFEETDIKAFILAANKYGQTALHIAARRGHFTGTSNSVQTHMDVKTLRELLMLKTKDNWSLLHLAAFTRNFRKVLSFHEGIFSDKEIYQSLRQRTKYGQTLIHVAARMGRFEVVANSLNDYMKKDEFVAFLLEKNLNNWTCLHHAACSGKCGDVISFLQKYIPKSEIDKLLFAVTSYEQTFLHIAAENGHYEITAKLAREYLDEISFQNLVLRKDRAHTTCLLYASKARSPQNHDDDFLSFFESGLCNGVVCLKSGEPVVH